MLLKKYIMEPGISRVYNGYLKSGSKQKLEKQTADLERVIEEEAIGAQGRRKKNKEKENIRSEACREGSY